MPNTPGADQLQALINLANETTGASDAKISDAIATLASGYSGGNGNATLNTYDSNQATPGADLFQALINYSNDVTGESDTTLSECVATLIAGYSTETWDYEWDYTQGLLSGNEWTSTISGTASETLDDSGVLLSATNGYIRMTAPTETMTTGVAEIIFKIVTIPNNGNCFRASLSNGSNGIQIAIPTYGEVTPILCLLNSTSARNYTRLTTITVGEWYTLRLVMDTSTSAVYLDGTLLQDSISNSSIKYCTGNRLWEQTDDTEGSTLIQSVKYKINRLS